MKVLVAGGGIAGLAAACAVALRGCDVEVYERAPALTEIGAGLQISPNGWRVLEALGVTDHLASKLFEPEAIELRMGRSGRRVWSLPMGQAARDRWRAPYVLVHRADLVEALATRLNELSPGALRLNVGIAGYKGNALLFDDGPSKKADVIIGADGLHSIIREHMLGPEKPTFTGNVAWRAVVPLDALGRDAPPEAVTVWAGNGRHAVTTRIRAGDMVNFVGMVETPEPGPEGWRITGTAEDAMRDFHDWARPIRRVIEEAQVLHRWALFARAPLPRWNDGSVILIGDAAHPMLPSFAQGAVQALEDAWVLAGLLVQEQDPATAGATFYQNRIQHVSRVQAMSQQNARMFHKAGGMRGLVYYGGMAAVTGVAPSIIRARQDWVYAQDVTA
jgi:salicylate hydroxylase